MSEQYHNPRATEEPRPGLKQEHLSSQSELMESPGGKLNKGCKVYLYKIYTNFIQLTNHIAGICLLLIRNNQLESSTK